LRAEFDEGRAYDRNRETAYKNYLLDIDKPCHDFDSYPFWLHEDEEDEGVFEAYIAHECEMMWTKEVQTYKRMEDLQGHSIPRLLGVVKYSPPAIHSISTAFCSNMSSRPSSNVDRSIVTKSQAVARKRWILSKPLGSTGS